MYQRGYRPGNVQRQQNGDHVNMTVPTSGRYRKHVDPSFIDPDGRNSFHLAVLFALRDTNNDNTSDMSEIGAWPSAMDQAVQAGCDVNAIDRWGFRPIHYAAEAGHLGCLRRLIGHGADPNALTGPSTLQINESSSSRSDVINLSPLMVAARRGRVDVVRFLLKNGARASLINSNGETAVHYAAGCTIRPEQCLHVLLGEGVKSPALTALMNAQDSSGCTALMVAVRNKSSHAALSAIQTLIELGADVSKTDAELRTALHIAAQKNIPEAVELLAKTMIDVNAADKQGHTAYVTAITSDSPAALQSLIDVGCDTSSIDGLMGTAIGLAALKGHSKVIETLIRNGEDPDECAYFGKTPLMLGAFEGRVQVVETLLRLGADPNIRSRSDGTAIMASMIKTTPSNEVARHNILVKLIQLGADVNLRGSRQGPATSGQNLFKTACGTSSGQDWPLSFAVDSGYISFVQILVAAGSRLPVEEIRQIQNRSTSLFDNNELLEPIIEASLQPASLQHICRASVRRAILSRCRSVGAPSTHSVSLFHIDGIVATLPIANRYRRYLLFGELEDVEIKRALVPSGADVDMMQLPGMTPCGLRAVVGMLMSQHSQSNGVNAP